MTSAAEKYIITQGRPGAIDYNEDGSLFVRSTLYLNDKLIPGATYFSFVWYYTAGKHEHQETHTHDFDEIVGFAGSDPEHPDNLNGHIRFFIDGEWVDLTHTCMLFVPAGVPHCPYEITSLDKPIIHWTTSNAPEYKTEQGGHH